MNAEEFTRQAGTVHCSRDDAGNVIVIRDDLTFWLIELASNQDQELVAGTLLWVADQLTRIEP